MPHIESLLPARFIFDVHQLIEDNVYDYPFTLTDKEDMLRRYEAAYYYLCNHYPEDRLQECKGWEELEEDIRNLHDEIENYGEPQTYSPEDVQYDSDE